MTTKCQLAFYQVSELPQEVLASVRYTCFDEEGLVSMVEQIEYKKNKASGQALEDQIIASLECAVDVAVMTEKDVTDFPCLSKYIEEHQSIG